MLTLNGKLLNIIDRPAGVRRDGTTFDAYSQLQVAVEDRLDDGQIRHDILTLSCDRPEPFREKLHKPVTLPVRAYVAGGGIRFALAAGGAS